MANFLSRLAGRTLGILPVAEPIIPARFSPGMEQAAQRPAVEATEGDARPLVRTIETDSNLVTHRPEPARAHAEAERHNLYRDPLQTRHNPFDNQLQGENFPVVPLSHNPSVPAVHELSPAMDPVAWMATDVSSPQIRAEVHSANARPADRERKVTATRADIAKQPQRETERAGPPIPSSSPAPTVKITIGRVDVRAEVAPPPPSNTQRRARPTTLSLDQFLRQRSTAER